MRPSTAFANHLAQAITGVPWSAPHMRRAILEDLPDWLSEQWVENLVDEILATSTTSYTPPPHVLVTLLRDCSSFWFIWNEAGDNIPFDRMSVRAPQFLPLPVFQDLDIPPLASIKDLAQWLDVPFAQLDWFAGNQSHFPPADQRPLRHYYYKVRWKRSGRLRMIEAPKKRLKAMQRRILHTILDPIRVHNACHGFTKARSVITGAQIHCSEAIVIKLDLADFFPSIRPRRIQGIFRCLGYPWQVAGYLTRLTTARVPAQILADIRFAPPPVSPDSTTLQKFIHTARQYFAQPRRLDFHEYQLYFHPHLPQGAPTSPALANLAAYKLDCRLAGLARSLNANYTRYADDLTFSGDKDFASGYKPFLKLARSIIVEEGFVPRDDKTRIMGASARQTVTGITVNGHVNLPRRDFDNLKAVLFNCARHGPASQNHASHRDFRAHLDGRVNWAEQLNPKKAAKLRTLYNKINWRH